MKSAPPTSNEAQMLACIPSLRRYARALIGERTAADDLVQDTLGRAWAHIASWREGGDMRAWLFGIMHNAHVDQLRKPHLAIEDASDEEFDVHTRATQADRLELRDIEAALYRLPEEQRQVVLLIALEELSYEEVAQALHIPLGTVMSRLSRGREKLRVLMNGRAQPQPLKVIK